MPEADARAALRELEEEVRRMDLRQAYQEMRRAQAEVARFQDGQRLAQRAAEVRFVLCATAGFIINIRSTYRSFLYKY